MTPSRPPQNLEQYTLKLKDAVYVFGIARQTIYNWVSSGRLIRGVHYLKPARTILIKREAFIQFLEDEDGSFQNR